MFDALARTFHKTLRYELRPTRRQAAGLARQAGARRWACNWALQRWDEHYRDTGETISLKQLSREMTQLRRHPDHGWLQEIDAQLLHQAIWDVRRAFAAFFARRAAYPKFKSRKREAPRFRIPQRVKVEGERVYVPKVGWVRVRLSRPAVGTRSATFKQTPSGKWFVSFVTRFEGPSSTEPLDHEVRALGIDLGLRDLLVGSNGVRVECPRFLRRSEAKLARRHRALSRKSRDSRNYERARLRLARAHAKVAGQRRDFLHKLTTHLIDQFDVLCIEDLCVQGLARLKLSKSASDAALREFRRQLEYKALWRGRTVVVVDRFFPSTKRCSACHAVNGGLRLEDRSWTCACGVRHDRDLNAARNILAEGLKQLVAVGHTDTENAGGARVGLPMEATGNEAGIPQRTRGNAKFDRSVFLPI